MSFDAAAFNSSLHANPLAKKCAVGWTTSAVQFESTIQYDDIQSKANPTVHVFINGKAAKMMLLDRGSASLIESKPIGQKYFRTMDMFGAETPQTTHMRLVDLIANGKNFKGWTGIPKSTLNNHGIVALDCIGMDILNDRVIYHSAEQHECTLLIRLGDFKKSTNQLEAR